MQIIKTIALWNVMSMSHFVFAPLLPSHKFLTCTSPLVSLNQEKDTKAQSSFKKKIYYYYYFYNFL